MKAALLSEYRKIVTTRMWWILLISFAGYVAFTAAAFGFSMHTARDTGAGQGADPLLLTDAVIASSTYGVATSIGYAFPLIVGTLLVTNEFRYQTLTPTFLAGPSRTIMLLAKLGASFVIGLVFGVVGVVATVATGAGAIAVAGGDTLLGDPEIRRGIVLSVVALAVWTVVGVGFGAVLPNQVAAIVVILGFTQLVEPVARLVLAVWPVTEGIARYLPGAAGDAIAGGSIYSMMSAGGVQLLEWWQGLLVLLAYAAVLSAIGRFTRLRRDVT
ncbi:ABC transporter permease [Cellulomonas sp. KRMCY2]|uniref:ABC transporter permease n=1 Tax=Cellulomonas sp. KRMCY2 TaxID=1304865 RepID=UPI00045EA51B|nr:ABC transporter permease [Cellulomonas sp. KRMCY2]